jgi:hypothetical protein
MIRKWGGKMDAINRAMDSVANSINEQTIERLKREVALLSDEAGTLRQRISDARDYLVEQREYMEEHAEQLADLLGVILTKSATVTVTVVHTIELEDVRGQLGEDAITNEVEMADWSFDGYLDDLTVASATYTIDNVEVEFDEN